MEHDDFVSNPTTNRPFEEILEARLQRRTVLAGGVALAATGFLTANPAGAVAGAAEGEAAAQASGPLIQFSPIPLDGSDRAIVSDDYNMSILAPWGEPIKRGAPPFSWPPSSSAQEEQVGIGHDGMWFFETGRGEGQLVMNHEFGFNHHVLGKAGPESLEDVRVQQAAHGISVLHVRQTSFGNWRVVRGRRSRRITVNSPVAFSGPVAGSELLETAAGNKPAGTLNNCANGYTPWGTYLTCEENFNGYFGATGDWTSSPGRERYGFSDNGFGYNWHSFDPRFDLANPDYVNEENRFGWVVEIDPHRNTKPVKRTALGRVKHEGVAIAIGKGHRIVAYMGDDQRFDYIYKFVSADKFGRMRRAGISPLDEGQLYVARFNEDGTGDWLELTIDNPALAAAFSSQAEILTYARIAADILGATPMDRPEWTTVAPDGHVYCTLTNNSRRTEGNAANPLAPNPDGHIIRWMDSDDHVGTTFEWDIFLFSADTQGTDHAYGSPDGIWADPDGRLFIQTDGAQPNAELRDSNNQMLVADPATGDIRRLFSGPSGCEVTGIAVTNDRRTMFINIQHPGNGDPTRTLFPDYDTGVIPRDATVVLTRKDRRQVGY